MTVTIVGIATFGGEDGLGPTTFTGAVLTAGGIGAVIAGASDGQPAPAGIGALLTAAGVVALGPVVARPVAAVLGVPIASTRGVAGVLARRNAVRTPRRTAATARRRRHRRDPAPDDRRHL